ncbi:hypothetical protein KSP39_PZI020284 [Platanthera zijinensis]|uniref:Uncharacterized protein n=1 Tax=Platanthera zijinensis TaxID=2320716 RepID=A0AAP0B0B3_9ASPA
MSVIIGAFLVTMQHQAHRIFRMMMICALRKIKIMQGKILGEKVLFQRRFWNC